MFEPFMCCIRICTSLTCKMCILRTNFLKKFYQVIFSKWNLSTMFGYSRRSNRNEDGLIYHTGHFGSKVIFEPANRVGVFVSGTDTDRRWNRNSPKKCHEFLEKMSIMLFDKTLTSISGFSWHKPWPYQSLIHFRLLHHIIWSILYVI